MEAYGRLKKRIYGFLTGIISILILSRNLCQSGLWYDEAVEYWISKVSQGAIPGFRNSFGMYDHINSTFQPPLYNVIMHFWLIFFDSEKGFRYSSVLLISLSTIAVYCIVVRLCNKGIVGLSISIVYVSMFCITYFAQECAEYALVICTISWMFFLWIKLIENFSTKSLIMFIAFACLSIYSQYGAVFAIAGMAIVLIIKLAKDRDLNDLRTVLISYFVAFVVAGIPLGRFFLLSQLKRATNNVGTHLLTFEKNAFVDLVSSFFGVAKFIFLGWNQVVKLCCYGFVMVILFTFALCVYFAIKNKKTSEDCAEVKEICCWIGLMTFITYLLYFVAVKANYYTIYYSSGFNNRYSLVVMPILFIFCTIPVLFMVVYAHVSRTGLYKILISSVLVIAILFGVGTYAVRLSRPWIKSNYRELTGEWLDAKKYEMPTIVTYVADPVFQFYLTHNDNYSENMQDEIINLNETEGVAPSLDLFDECLGKSWPAEFCYISSVVSDMDSLRTNMKTAGYETDIEYEGKDCQMLCFSKIENH